MADEAAAFLAQAVACLPPTESGGGAREIPRGSQGAAGTCPGGVRRAGEVPGGSLGVPGGSLLEGWGCLGPRGSPRGVLFGH